MRILKISKITALFLTLALLFSAFPVSALPRQADLKAATVQEFPEETGDASDDESTVTVQMVVRTLRCFTGYDGPSSILYEASSCQEFIDWLNTADAGKISGYDPDNREKLNSFISAVRKEDKILLPVYEGKVVALRENAELRINGSDFVDTGYHSFAIKNLPMRYFQVKYVDEKNKPLLETGYEKYLEQVHPDYPRSDNWVQINTEKNLAMTDMYTENIEINGKNTECRITVLDYMGVRNALIVEFILDSKIISVHIWQAAYDQGMLQKITFEPVSLRVSIKDAVGLLRYLAGEIPLSDLSWNAFNINDEITIKNAVRMLRSLAGMADSTESY